MRALMLAAIVLGILARPVAADDAADAAKVVKDLVDAVLQCLRQDELTAAQKRDRIMETVTPVIDFALMGKLVLGKQNWPKLDEGQQQTYTDLFVRQLRESYSRKIELFADEQVEFGDPEQVGGKVHVGTTVIAKNERTAMLYKLYKAGDAWKVYDVEIDGVSIVSSYRAQYDQVLRDGTVEDLLNRMREKADAAGSDGD